MPLQLDASQTTVVLLPGSLCDERLWAGGEGIIRATFEKRGFDVADGDLTKSSTISGMAAMVIAQTPGRLLPVGFSMGGIVALEMARQAPDRIAALVLADTNPGADLPERAAARPSQQARVRRGGLSAFVTGELLPLYMAKSNQTDRGLSTIIMDMALALGPDVFCSQSEALRTRADARAVPGRFNGPLLLLVGAEDALCSPTWHRAMADQAHDATLRVIADAGHMLPLEQPAAVANAIATWFDGDER